jgi:hypothetical protein
VREDEESRKFRRRSAHYRGDLHFEPVPTVLQRLLRSFYAVITCSESLRLRHQWKGFLWSTGPSPSRSSLRLSRCSRRANGGYYQVSTARLGQSLPRTGLNWPTRGSPR